MNKHQRYLTEMNLVRAFAIVAVLLIHSTSSAVNSANVNSSFYFLYVLINKMSTFAVPLFLFLSGFVLMYSYQKREVTLSSVNTFYKRRVTNVIIPYIIFSCIYFTLTHIDSLSLHSFADLGEAILLGKAYAHLYYIFVMVQFYLLFPILWKKITTRKSAAIWIWLIGFIIQWAYFYINREYLSQLEDLPQLFKRTASLFVSYTAYFGCGVWIATRYSQILQFLEKHTAQYRIYRIVLLVAWICSGVYYANLFYRGWVHKDWESSPHFAWTWFIFIMISIALSVISSRYYEQKCPAWLQRIITSLSDHSFGIYLIHPLLLYMYRKLPMSGNPILFNLYFAGQFIFGLFVAWILTILISKYIPYATYIVGSGKKRSSK
ncbi:acyltransferase [Paenibacillus endoradicis]|uniref:acyltransferase n=1 Tax=Paenibacillus endoradicis TaxID=2972487 RepID=UPI002159456D|nr:acyltransferase [Paenibacillus endoradicis]MCR8657344.1 acyltransferase [Paenibacillus endoradicis]